MRAAPACLAPDGNASTSAAQAADGDILARLAESVPTIGQYSTSGRYARQHFVRMDPKFNCGMRVHPQSGQARGDVITSADQA